MNGVLFYYTNSGNAKVVADILANDYEIRELRPVKDLVKPTFFKILQGGFLAGLKVKRKLNEYDKDIAKFEKVIIVSPVWNGNFSAPINTLLFDLQEELKDKKLCFIMCSASGEAKGADKRIKEMYPDSKIIHFKNAKANYDDVCLKLKDELIY